MAKEGRKNGQGLDGVAEAARQAGARGLPPVHLWNPPYCGDLDLRIASDGTWHYLRTPIGRPALVRLFASVLKREGDKHFLVTPVEKIGITVDDAPFLAVDMEVVREGGQQILRFRTNVDDVVTCGPGHALRFDRQPDGESVKPYLHVRRDLWAKLSRPVFYDLVDLGEEREVDGRTMFGVMSSGVFYPIEDADNLKDRA